MKYYHVPNHNTVTTLEHKEGKDHEQYTLKTLPTLQHDYTTYAII